MRKFFTFKYNKIGDRSGMTLVELLVSLSIFAIFISVAIGGFVQALANQRLVLKLMSATDNMSLTLEQIMREVRVSDGFVPDDGGNETDFIEFTRKEVGVGGDLDEYRIRYDFVEGLGDELGYIKRTKTLLGGGGSLDQVSERITADDVEVTDFRVIADRDGDVEGPVRITLVVGVSATDKGRTITNHIQTTISSRIF